MKIDNDMFKLLRPALTKALKGVEEELGIKIELGNGSMDRSHKVGSIKLELAAVGAHGTVENREALAFKQMASVYGFEPGDLGREFTCNRKRYRVSGLRTKARSKPILAIDVLTGKEYIWSAETVRLYLDREAKVA